MGGLPDVLKDKENALVFMPGSIPELSSALEQMIVDIDLRARIAAESLLLAKNIFNPEVINKHLNDIYHNLLEDN